MSESHKHLAAAHFHAKQCVKCIRRALTSVGSDPDAPIIDDEPSSGYADDPDLLPPDSVRSRYLLR